MILLAAVVIFLGAFLFWWWEFGRDDELHVKRDDYEAPMWRWRR